MELVISGVDDELSPLLRGKGINRLFHEKTLIEIIINGINTDFVLTQTKENPRTDGYGCYTGYNDVVLTFESLRYPKMKLSKEEIQAQEAVQKAKESLKAAEDTLNAVKVKQ